MESEIERQGVDEEDMSAIKNRRNVTISEDLNTNSNFIASKSSDAKLKSALPNLLLEYGFPAENVPKKPMDKENKKKKTTTDDGQKVHFMILSII